MWKLFESWYSEWHIKTNWMDVSAVPSGDCMIAALIHWGWSCSISVLSEGVSSMKSEDSIQLGLTVAIHAHGSFVFYIQSCQLLSCWMQSFQPITLQDAHSILTLPIMLYFEHILLRLCNRYADSWAFGLCDQKTLSIRQKGPPLMVNTEATKQWKRCAPMATKLPHFPSACDRVNRLPSINSTWPLIQEDGLGEQGSSSLQLQHIRIADTQWHPFRGSTALQEAQGSEVLTFSCVRETDGDVDCCRNAVVKRMASSPGGGQQGFSHHKQPPAFKLPQKMTSTTARPVAAIKEVSLPSLLQVVQWVMISHWQGFENKIQAQ